MKWDNQRFGRGVREGERTGYVEVRGHEVVESTTKERIWILAGEELVYMVQVEGNKVEGRLVQTRKQINLEGGRCRQVSLSDKGSISVF